MSYTMADLKNTLRSLLGHKEDSSNTVKERVGQLMRKQHIYQWPVALKAAAVANPATKLDAQTASKSLSQPLAARTVFIADKDCRVIDATFAQHVSSTVTATLTMSWTLLLRKRGGTASTYSKTYSVTTFIAGLTSATTKPSFSWSYSHLQKNVAFAPNKLMLAKTTTKLDLKRGDVITAAVLKGSGHADDSGAIFFGGTLKITVEEQ